LIRIHAAAVTASDIFIRSAIPNARLAMRIVARLAIGLTRPRRPILGAVLAGEVESVGARATKFRAGDRVWAFTLMRMSCYAERIALPETAKLLGLAPSNLSFAEAAAIPYGGLISAYFLQPANIAAGANVAVYGASGANGTFAVQFAKHRGARVTGVCSGQNVELVKSLGADRVVDYTDPNARVDEEYDLVFDAVGRRKTSAIREVLRDALTPTGRMLSVDDTLPRVKRADLELLKELTETGAIKPVIDRVYSLAQVAEAHRYVELGHKKGNVIIAMSP